VFTIDELNKFLDRPNGGVEVEILYAISEIWFGITILLTPVTLLNMISLRELYWLVPHYIMCIPWLFAGTLTISGLLLYRKGYTVCAPMRLLGSYISTGLWFLMLGEGVFEAGAALGSLAFYFFGCVWQVRIMISAKRRLRAGWNG